ncbi:MAG: chemotaxis protein CheW [Pseudomonadota bacterium]
MDTAPSDIYSLLIPLHGHRLLLPRANVSEVTGYRETVPVDGAPSWLLGQFQFEGQMIPLVSFETAIGAPAPERVGRARIVLLRTLSDALSLPCIGLVTYGFPQLVRVNPTVLSPADGADWPDEAPVLCQLRMLNQTPLVPDIEQLETMVADALSN